MSSEKGESSQPLPGNEEEEEDDGVSELDRPFVVGTRVKAATKETWGNARDAIVSAASGPAIKNFDIATMAQLRDLESKTKQLTKQRVSFKCLW